MEQAIIFCRTKLDCDNLEEFLSAKGYACLCLHGSRNPKERAENLQRFKVSWRKGGRIPIIGLLALRVGI